MSIRKILPICIAVLFLSTLAFAQSIDDVINRYIDAMGGKASIDAIKSVSMTMSGTVMGSMEMEMKMFNVKPDKIRTEVNMMGQDIISGSDGTDYWMVMGGTVMDMPEDQKQSMQMNQGSLTGGFASILKQEGVDASYLGRENVNGVDFEVIEFTMNQMTGKLLFEVAGGLLTLMQMDSPMGAVEMTIGDYRDVSGVKYPHKMEASMGGQAMMTLTITEVLVNSAIDENLFKRPAE